MAALYRPYVIEKGAYMSTMSPIPRRSFLAASSIVSGLLVAGGPLSLIAPGRAWALELKTFTSVQGTALMSLARTIAPHDGLEDAAYALVVKAIDAAATADEQLRSLVTSGLAGLGEGFASQSEAARVAALKAVEHSDFFKLMRASTLANLYSSTIAYAHFGYEGEAFSKGGYLTRGFNDLHWLPEVPLQDSGPGVGGG
jgi:hypothetical protein